MGQGELCCAVPSERGLCMGSSSKAKAEARHA